MGYSIVFETKIVLLSDGRLIHFSRDGCNNDDFGRRRDEFTAKIYTREEFERCAKCFMENSAPHTEEKPCFDLKIGNRIASYYDYGAHLLRMLSRAKLYSAFIRERNVNAQYCTGIEIEKPYRQFVSCREFEDTWRDLLQKYGHVSYNRIMEYPDIRDENAIVKLIEKDTPMNFYIGPKHKK